MIIKTNNKELEKVLNKYNLHSKEEAIVHLEKTLDWFCKKSDRDIFIIPPIKIDDHINYLVDEINTTVRIYAKQINAGKKNDANFVKFFPEILRQVRLH